MTSACFVGRAERVGRDVHAATPPPPRLCALTRETSDCSHLRAVVVNSGNANACTGAQGRADAARMQALTAWRLHLPAKQVAVASTGLIGVALPMDRIEIGIEAAAQTLKTSGSSPAAAAEFASAMRTTDKFAKGGALEVELAGGVVHLGLAAKGCGMISPNMATMLCFVTCDADVSAQGWDRLLRAAVAKSFNRITVDGQESTNDMVLGLCNGASGVKPGEEGRWSCWVRRSTRLCSPWPSRSSSTVKARRIR